MGGWSVLIGFKNTGSRIIPKTNEETRLPGAGELEEIRLKSTLKNQVYEVLNAKV